MYIMLIKVIFLYKRVRDINKLKESVSFVFIFLISVEFFFIIDIICLRCLFLLNLRLWVLSVFRSVFEIKAFIECLERWILNIIVVYGNGERFK